MVRPRWILASFALHATAIGCCIAWFGLEIRRYRLPVAVNLELARESETIFTEESVTVPVEHPELIEDSMLVEVVASDPGEPEERVEQEIDDACDPRPPDTSSASDWLLVVRPKRPERVLMPPAPPVIARTKITPTPLAGSNSPPRYPRRAARLGIHGTVILSVEVRADGRVESCEVETSSGSRLLDEAARRAVRDWQFRGGPGVVLVPVVFTLARSARSAR
jgi:protein TonB